jgi:hypothetical protein
MKRTGELRFSTSERKMWGKLSYVKFDRPSIDQSYEHPSDVFRTALAMLFLFDFSVQYDHWMGKIVTFHSTQSRAL